MVRKLFTYIFIYTLMVGCHAILGPEEKEIWAVDVDEVCTTNYILSTEALNLVVDDAGYYHIKWVEGYMQTFVTLSAETKSEKYSQKVFWVSNSGIYHMDDWISSVNYASYTGSDGIANSVLAVWKEQINDTIMVYTAFEDECGYIYDDFLGVIVE